MSVSGSVVALVVVDNVVREFVITKEFRVMATLFEGLDVDGVFEFEIRAVVLWRADVTGSTSQLAEGVFKLQLTREGGSLEVSEHGRGEVGFGGRMQGGWFHAVS